MSIIFKPDGLLGVGSPFFCDASLNCWESFWGSLLISLLWIGWSTLLFPACSQGAFELPLCLVSSLLVAPSLNPNLPEPSSWAWFSCWYLMKHSFRQLPWPLGPCWALVWGVWERRRGKGTGVECQLSCFCSHIYLFWVCFLLRFWNIKETLDFQFFSYFNLFITGVFRVSCIAAVQLACLLHAIWTHRKLQLQKIWGSIQWLPQCPLREGQSPMEVPQGVLRDTEGHDLY